MSNMQVTHTLEQALAYWLRDLAIREEIYGKGHPINAPFEGIIAGLVDGIERTHVRYYRAEFIDKGVQEGPRWRENWKVERLKDDGTTEQQIVGVLDPRETWHPINMAICTGRWSKLPGGPTIADGERYAEIEGKGITLIEELPRDQQAGPKEGQK